MRSREDFQKFITSFHTSSKVYSPDFDDLYFLYRFVREKSIVSILEYGSGWSTLALALALFENKEAFGEKHLKNIRHPNPFRLMTIDASNNWQEVAFTRLPKFLQELVEKINCGVHLTEIENSFACRYEIVPNFIPDLIYLDGPDDNQIEGEVRGFKYGDRFTPPMVMDLLLLEPILWPESYIITDGRTANARFLKARFLREWESMHDPFGDRTIFRLAETPFGSISSEHIQLRIKESLKLVNKEVPALKHT